MSMTLYVKFILGVIAYLLIGIAFALPFIMFDIARDNYNDNDGEWYYSYIVGWPLIICIVIIWGPFYLLKKAFDKLNKIVREATK